MSCLTYGSVAITILMVMTMTRRSCESARILVMHSTSARSHSLVMEPVFEELAARGHHLTMVTCFPRSPPVPNLKSIDISHLAHKITSNLTLDTIKRTMGDPFITPFFMADLELKMCEQVFLDKPIQELLKNKESFDLVMAETFAADCYVAFANKFKVPFITFVTSSSLAWISGRSGLPDNPSYIPNYLFRDSLEMTFFQRLYNTIVLTYSKLVHSMLFLPRVQRLINKHFGESAPDLGNLLKNTSLVFVNSHFSMSTSRPFPPNVVEIGGIHLTNSTQPLAKDLQHLLDHSPQGVIVSSFGSLVRTASIPPSTIRAFLNAFAKVPQTVLFKYEEPLSDLPLPPNVVLREWLPQRQLMEHKNVKAVLTHGGMASIIEAVHFGKPLVGIPFFADQYLNINSVVSRGAGRLLHLEELTEQDIEHSLKEVLNNPSYKENMERLSLQFRDRPMTPLQTAVFWTEYVIRHQGAPHLRPASVDLPLYQYLLLDVIAVLLFPLLLFFYIVYYLFFKAVELSPNDEKFYEIKKTN